MGVVAFDTAVEPTLAAPVGDPFSMGAPGPVAIFLGMAAAAHLIPLIDVDRFGAQVPQRVVIRLIVAREAPDQATAMLQARGVSLFDVQLADAFVGIHEFMTIVAGVEEQLVDASTDGK
jgi:hypothetical protein